VHDDLRYHPKQKVPEQAHGKAEIRPIVSFLQYLQHIALHVYLSSKIHLMERLHGDLTPSTVLHLVTLALELEVMLHRTTRIPCFLILARRYRRGKIPKGCEDGDGGEDGEEDCCPETTSDLPREVVGDADKEGEEESVGEAFGAGGVCRKRGIFDRWILRTCC
jgi:hypothetical protein